MTTTNGLTAAILDWLLWHGALAWRNNTGAMTGQYTRKDGSTHKRFVRFGEKGSSDILGCWRDGRMLAIEIKTGRDKLSPEQRQFLDAVTEHGGYATEARALDDVLKLFGLESEGVL